MNLVTQFLAGRRDKLLMKLGCWLVCFSLVLGLMLPQQKAEAVGTLTIAAVASVAAAYLGACGMTFVTQGMDKDTLVSTTQRLIQEFLDTELGGITIQDWLGSVWNVAVLAGKIIMGRPLTEEMMDFAQWVAGKYGTQVGNNLVYSDQSITFADGSTYNLALLGKNSPASGSHFDRRTSKAGSPISFGTSSNPTSIELLPGKIAQFAITADDDYPDILSFYSPLTKRWYSDVAAASQCELVCFVICDQCLCLCFVMNSATITGYYSFYVDGCGLLSVSDTKKLSLSNVDLSIDRAPSMSYIPEGIAAEQGIALDVGAAATMDFDQVCQGVLDDVIAGELTSTMTAADEKTEPVDPPAEELPDVGELGLPALGAALTSRFPFSIPWDFFRAVQLLAAPAKAPYFEVDFMEPLADDVGGWQGDTTVILDFSEYAIIGQISRWTSTIGFCLMLAGATKRLIWTA